MEIVTRQMPRPHEIALKAMAATPKQYDGRSAKTIDALLDLRFAEVTARDEKNPRKRTVAITERGQYALERIARGVDPYLRMTA